MNAVSFISVYILGGVTMLPFMFLILYLLSYERVPSKNKCYIKQEYKWEEVYKTGWVSIQREWIHGDNYREETECFVVLKLNKICLYDSELQQDCQGMVHIKSVSIFPYHKHETFSRQQSIQITSMEEDTYFIDCRLCVDKEDWYYALKKSIGVDYRIHTFPTLPEDSHLWLNALLGRLFFTWKTDKIRSMFYSKIKSKIDQLNARRPSFLEEITIRSFDEGHRPPHFSDPQLIHLSSHGEYVADVMMHYEGECRVELETVLQWKYSDRLPPIQLDIVLAVTCQSMSGKMRVRIKEPPSNILWIGFHKAPHMKWYVEPVFWEKRMGYSLVSKAIQSKLEEIIKESMVLPHMDDITFSSNDPIQPPSSNPRPIHRFRHKSSPSIALSHIHVIQSQENKKLNKLSSF